MPLPKKELNKIEESHQTRPYLVVAKDNFYIYAYQSSSKQCNRLNNCQQYVINKLHYHQNKDSFINLTQIYKIPFINLRNKSLSLNQLDLKNVQKRLSISSDNIYNFPVDISISDGDVILVANQLYYVYASDNVNLYCFVIYPNYPKDCKIYKSIAVNNKIYYTTFKAKMIFPRTVDFNVVNIAYPNEIEAILEQKRLIDFNEKSLSSAKKKMPPKTHELTYESGTVFESPKGKIAYLFKYKNVHYGVDLLMYKIKPRVFPIYHLDKKHVLEVLPSENFMKIVEVLSSNNVHPINEINKLYYELREIVYS